MASDDNLLGRTALAQIDRLFRRVNRLEQQLGAIPSRAPRRGAQVWARIDEHITDNSYTATQMMGDFVGLDATFKEVSSPITWGSDGTDVGPLLSLDYSDGSATGIVPVWPISDGTDNRWAFQWGVDETRDYLPYDASFTGDSSWFFYPGLAQLGPELDNHIGTYLDPADGTFVYANLKLLFSEVSDSFNIYFADISNNPQIDEDPENGYQRLINTNQNLEYWMPQNFDNTIMWRIKIGEWIDGGDWTQLHNGNITHPDTVFPYEDSDWPAIDGKFPIFVGGSDHRIQGSRMRQIPGGLNPDANDVVIVDILGQSQFRNTTDGSTWINDEYVFPLANGTEGQVMTSHADRQATWEDPSGGGGGDCTEIIGDSTWLEQDATDVCQLNHIGPGEAKTVYSWDCTDGTCSLTVDGTAVDNITLGEDAVGHLVSEFGPPTEEGWYCVETERWAAPATCATYDPDNPQAVFFLCMDYIPTILGFYGGWNNCQESPSAGVTVCKYKSGPFADSATCLASSDCTTTLP